MSNTYNLDKSQSDKFTIIFPKFPVMDYLSEAREFSLNIFTTAIPGVNLPSDEEH